MSSEDDFMDEASVASEGDESFFGEDENQALNHVHAAKEAAADKAPVLHPSTNAAGKKKTVEETYQKKTPLEHILLRPDTYSKFRCAESTLSNPQRKTNRFLSLTYGRKTQTFMYLLYLLNSWFR